MLVKRIRKVRLSSKPFMELGACRHRECDDGLNAFCRQFDVTILAEECLICTMRTEAGAFPSPPNKKWRGKVVRGNVDRLAPCKHATPGKKFRQSCRKVKQMWKCSKAAGMQFTRKHCENNCVYRNTP